MPAVDETQPPKSSETTRQTVVPTNYRHVYPEFLPDPKVEWRNGIRERLERADMLKRRTHIDIPEFYVGTILAVTISDKHSVGKSNKFVGICIQRKFCGLRAEFTLRNFVDSQGTYVCMI
jgi:large subunit ribosomal protein L19